MTTVHIGCGAGFANDRPDAALALANDLAARDGRRFLFFELLAERTLAEAQLRRLADAESGYATRLFDFLEPVLETCLAAGIPIITNGGAANPSAAARRLRQQLQGGRFAAARIACVVGDDLLDSGEVLQRWLPETLNGQVVSVNVYTGADGIVQALDAGADIVLCGRVADPSLAVGPLRHAFGWQAEDWDRIALATAVGHLLECCTQVSGGYFAHPGLKEVPDLANVGCPIATVQADGRVTIGKAAGTGGCVTERTVKEQLLYEVHDPAAYLTPDVTMDLSQARVRQAGPDLVEIEGIRGHPRPAELKGLVGLRGNWFAEAEISYAGLGALARAALARDVLLQRCARLAPQLTPWIDLIGVASLFNDARGEWLQQRLADARDPQDVRLRISFVDADKALLETLLLDAESLYTNGPAGGGGVRRHLSESLGTASFFIPRTAVQQQVEWF
ncbi:acyclic terpene utilization AtuA family protein [Pseudomonas sp. G34]|uniref:acyclic terpene utilization AtuA family protein n=1 Tax=Pseudomonas sp. G34 TaxID=3059083 RepID=UPI00280874C2|nr:acyclic terpene utilization AtuA family protein [Pseudomonas sp. G34]MDQ7984034.1 acyclic terpene utilization AtuA family protein [Pseudomonas sp. G34]